MAVCTSGAGVHSELCGVAKSHQTSAAPRNGERMRGEVAVAVAVQAGGEEQERRLDEGEGA